MTKLKKQTTSKPPKDFLVVFDAQEDGGGRPFAPRRTHNKSRAGCSACKARRVKCDEHKPACTRCERVRVPCVYATPSPQASSLPSASLDTGLCASPCPDTAMHTMSVALVSSQIDTLFASSGLQASLNHSSGNVRALQHFHAVTASTIGPPYMTAFIQALVLPKAWSDPALMHLALAVSSAHQRRLILDKQDQRTVQRLRFNEIQHWQSALTLHQKQIATKELPQDVGAYVLKLSLTVIFTFALDDALPVDTFLGGQDAKIAHAMAPIAACNGFRALRVMTNSWNTLDLTSPWASVLTSADDAASTFTDEQAGVVGLPAAFVDLCNLDDASTSDNNVYHKVVRLLTPLLQLEPGLHNFVRLLAFGGRIWLDIKFLASKRDHITLLLVAYWLALLRQVDQWWMLTRAKSACDAIVNYLLQNSRDSKLHYLLLYPASFGERGLDRIWTKLVSARPPQQN